MKRWMLVALVLGIGIAKAQEPENTTGPVVVAPEVKVARISGGVMAGQILTKVNPVYPTDAKVEGSVVLQAIIGRDGNIKNLTVISGNPLLAQAALDAVSQWTYRPYLLNGEPTEVDTTITVNFHLTHPATPPSNPSTLPADVVRISGSVMQGLLLKHSDPVYPAQARAAHIQGQVLLEAIIGKDGKVESLQVQQGHPALQQAAVDAVKDWRYKPYLENGVPARVGTTIMVSFRQSW